MLSGTHASWSRSGGRDVQSRAHACRSLRGAATRGRGKGGCRGEEAGGRRQRAGGACTWGGAAVGPRVDRNDECWPSSVHFTRRSSYYATATKPGPTCSKKGCLNCGTVRQPLRIGSQGLDHRR
eukprot:scaffold8911_cov43-Phaeocystis_antarctica.AAC.1